MLHSMLRGLVNLLLRQFYSRITVKGAPVIDDQSVLFVANHPNYLMDSLIVASQVNRSVSFLAKGTLFANPLLSRVLRVLKVIPVYRRRDEGSDTTKNKDTFRAVSQALNSGEAIALFPEGVSMGERKIYPVKTGAARMAFQALEESKWEIPVFIQPLGITYSDFGIFKSSLTVIVSEPINVASLRSEYENGERAAVQALTNRIEEELKAVTIEVENDAHIELIESISRLYALVDDEGASDHARMELVAANVEALAPNNPVQAEKLLKSISSLLDTIKRYGLDMGNSVEFGKSRFFLFLALPFVCIGELIHFFPYRAVAKLSSFLCKHPVERASKKLLLGLLLFPLWSIALALIALFLWKGYQVFIFTLLLCFISGYYVSFYLHHLRLMLWDLVPGKWSAVKQIRKVRDEIICELEGLRVV